MIINILLLESEMNIIFSILKFLVADEYYDEIRKQQ